MEGEVEKQFSCAFRFLFFLVWLLLGYSSIFKFSCEQKGKNFIVKPHLRKLFSVKIQNYVYRLGV